MLAIYFSTIPNRIIYQRAEHEILWVGRSACFFLNPVVFTFFEITQIQDWLGPNNGFIVCMFKRKNYKTCEEAIRKILHLGIKMTPLKQFLVCFRGVNKVSHDIVSIGLCRYFKLIIHICLKTTVL